MKYLCPDLPANLNIFLPRVYFLSQDLCHVMFSRLPTCQSCHKVCLSHTVRLLISTTNGNGTSRRIVENVITPFLTLMFFWCHRSLPIEPSLNFMNWPQKVVSSHLKYYQTTIARPSYSSYSSYSRYKSDFEK